MDPVPPPPTPPPREVKVIFKRTDGHLMKSIPPWIITKFLAYQPDLNIPKDLTAALSPDGKSLSVTPDSVTHRCRLMEVQVIDGIRVQASEAGPRVQGSIWAPELDLLEPSVLETGLKSEGVTAVYRPPKGPRALLILTFCQATLPERVKAGYLSYTTRPIQPKPRRCSRCQRYGHLANHCRGKVRCSFCSGDHPKQDCTAATPKCPACSGKHPVESKDCPEWIRQRKVQELIQLKGLPPAEAKLLASSHGRYQSDTPRRQLAETPPTRREALQSRSSESTPTPPNPEPPARPSSHTPPPRPSKGPRPPSEGERTPPETPDPAKELEYSTYRVQASRETNPYKNGHKWSENSACIL